MAESRELLSPQDTKRIASDLAIAESSPIVYRLLVNIDDDNSIQNVEDTVLGLAQARSLTNWLMGDIFVFMREKYRFDTVEVITWQGGPETVSGHVLDRLYEITGTRYANFPEPEEFTQWDVFKFPHVWVLRYHHDQYNELRIWKPKDTKRERSDDEFETYMGAIYNRLSTVLGEKSISAYYRTSQLWPPSKRVEYDWTFFYEITNLAATTVREDPDLVTTYGGELEAKQQVARKILKEQETIGDTRVTAVRRRIAEKKNERKGYKFCLPPQKAIYIEDLDGGEIYPVVSFEPGCDYQLIKAMLIYSGIISHQASNYKKIFHLLWHGDDLIDLRDGKKIATVVNADVPVVAQALVKLSGEMKWKVKR